MSPFLTQVSGDSGVAGRTVSEVGRFILCLPSAGDPGVDRSPAPGPQLTSDDFLNRMLASVFAGPQSPAFR